MNTTELCGLKCRANNACDEAIIRNVIERNEYRLGRFNPRDAIVDVGAHIGAFSAACLERGAGYVEAYECAEANFGLLSENLRKYPGRATAFHKAVWRSDSQETTLAYTGPGKEPSGVENHGGGNVVFNGDQNIPVQSIGLDTVLKWFENVRLLKLDCEASEWPILFTSMELGRVQEIIGEFHEIGGEFNQATIPERAAINGFQKFTCDALVAFLVRHGYGVETLRKRPENMGLFWAKRA